MRVDHIYKMEGIKMKIFFLISLASSMLLAAESSQLSLKPSLYSRGGITMNMLKTKEGAGTDRFNLGAWGDQTNAVSNNLTELTLEAKYGESLKYTYGVDVENSNRFYNGTQQSLHERLNFMEFYQENMSLWFGNRAYRGDGDYLLMNWPLDEHNLLGGGIRFEKVGQVNLEFAAGIKANFESAPHNINIWINKIEYPLANGKLKSNIEVHKINAPTRQDSLAYITGGQYQRWGDTIMSGSLYNIFVLNYSKGNIYSGTMRSLFNSSDKHNLASKVLAKWGGDWKSKTLGLYYAFQYQRHMGKASNQTWSFIDCHLRPIYAFTGNITLGLDFSQRYTFEMDNLQDSEGYSSSNEWQYHKTLRSAIMLAYNVRNKMFDTASARVFVGRVMSEKARQYFVGEAKTEADNFVRFSYEISL